MCILGCLSGGIAWWKVDCTSGEDRALEHYRHVQPFVVQGAHHMKHSSGKCEMSCCPDAACPGAGSSSTLDKEARVWWRRLLIGGAFALPVAVVSMGSMLPGLDSWGRGPVVLGSMPLLWVVQAVLAAVVQVGP